MTIRAELADGRVLEFPDGTDPSVIQRTVKSMISGQERELGAVDTAKGVGEAALTVATGAIAEPVSGLLGLAATPFVGAQKGAEIVKGTQEALTFQPRTESGQQSIQTLGDLVQKGIDIAEIPISGLAGIAELARTGGNIEQAVKQISQIQEQGVGKSLGQQTFQATGSPVLAAVAEAAPTAAVEALGVKAPAGVARRLESAAEAKKAAGTAAMRQADQIRNPTSEKGLEKVAESIKKSTPEEVADIVKPDPEFYRAADELNINTEPLASFASQNPQFRAVEQGLSSIPASQLDAQGKAFISELSQKADDLITEFGGTLDKAELSDRFRTESLASVDDLGKQADSLYDSLRTAIPLDTRVKAPATVEFLKQKSIDVGGKKNLSPKLSKILRQLEGKKGGQPTYGLLDQVRKEVGQALNSRSGRFKDQETGLMKAIYARLRSDQDAVAESLGVSDVSDSANALIRQRKQIEDNLSKLLGKDLQGSILPKVGLDLKRLARGDIQKWDSTMSRIPENIRKEIVVSSLNDIFRGNNTQGQALNITQFTKFMDDLDRQPAVKARLYKELPKESIRALENLKKVSKGVSIALQDKIPTGRVAAFFDDNQGFLRKMMGNALSLAITAKAGPLAASAASEFINQSSNGAKAASAVLASPRFQSMIRSAVREGVTDGAELTKALKSAEKSFEKGQQYKRWASSLSENEKSKLISVGTIGYLLSPEEEEK